MTVRVSPPRIFPEAARAGRPPAGSAGATDAYRQTAFVLSRDVELVVAGLNLEGSIAAASAGAKYRTQRTAGALVGWSRSWLCRLQALHAVEYGNYIAALPLIGAATNHTGAMFATIDDGAAAWQAWIDSGAIAISAAEHGTEIRHDTAVRPDPSASCPALAPIQRIAEWLSSTEFGAAVMLAAGDSTSERVLVTFGDRDFHAGLAELCLGLILSLGGALTEHLEATEGIFNLEARKPLATWRSESAVARADRDRCRVEIVERDGADRLLIHNWRRAAGAAPKRLLL